MADIDRALRTLNEIEVSSALRGTRVDVRARLVVTLGFLIAVLSLPLDNLAAIILFAVYPVAASSLEDIPYRHVFKISLYTLPFIIFIGIFNPIFDHRPMLHIGSWAVSAGWVQFLSIILRGLLSVQATAILILSCGFTATCRGLRRMGLPALFATQLFMLYRYIFVLLAEAHSMDRARRSRGYGRKSYGMRFWASFVGELLLRTTSRAERIHGAMLSRGFSGEVPYSGGGLRWRISDTLFMLVWLGIFCALRFIDIPGLFSSIA